MQGMFTDFSDGGDPKNVYNAAHSTSEFQGKFTRVGGSFAGEDSPYDLNMGNSNGQPADMNTVWGIQTQNARIGGGVE